MSVYGGVFRIPPPLMQMQARKILATPPNLLLSVVIGLVDRTANIRKDTMKITTVLTNQPSTAAMTVFGFDPVVGSPIVITAGTKRFAGTVQRVIQQSIRMAGYKLYDIECIDWTWLLNRRRVTKNYASGTASDAIITDLITSYTSGFTVVHVQTGSPTITSNVAFTNSQVTVALQQVADAVAWRWNCDVDRDIHFYPTAAVAPTRSTYTVVTTGTSFVVPGSVTTVTVKAWGGAGGSDGSGNAGGGCGFAQATIGTTPGETLTVKVGGGGAAATNGWQGGAGGGYSGVFRGSTALVLAGGGGGAAHEGIGGPGGGTAGAAGIGPNPAGGGTASAGGAAGANSDGATIAATAGASLTGGTGGGWTTGSGSAAAGGTNGGGNGGAGGSS